MLRGVAATRSYAVTAWNNTASAGARGSLPRGRAEGGADADAGSAQQRRGDLPLRRLSIAVSSRYAYRTVPVRYTVAKTNSKQCDFLVLNHEPLLHSKSVGVLEEGIHRAATTRLLAAGLEPARLPAAAEPALRRRDN